MIFLCSNLIFLKNWGAVSSTLIEIHLVLILVNYLSIGESLRLHLRKRSCFYASYFDILEDLRWNDHLYMPQICCSWKIQVPICKRYLLLINSSLILINNLLIEWKDWGYICKKIKFFMLHILMFLKLLR